MCSSRCRRQVVSEGPLKGPEGSSVAMDAGTDEDEWVRSSGGAVGGVIMHPRTRRRVRFDSREDVRVGPGTSFGHDHLL